MKIHKSFRFSVLIIALLSLTLVCTNDIAQNTDVADTSGTLRMAILIPDAAIPDTGRDISIRIGYNTTSVADYFANGQNGWLQYTNITATTDNTTTSVAASDLLLPAAFEIPSTRVNLTEAMQVEIWEDTDGNSTYFEATDTRLCVSAIEAITWPAPGVTQIESVAISCGNPDSGVLTIEGTAGEVFWIGGMFSAGADAAGATPANKGKELTLANCDTVTAAADCEGNTALTYTVEIKDGLTAATTYASVVVDAVPGGGATKFFLQVNLPSGTLAADSTIDIVVTSNATGGVGGGPDWDTWNAGGGADYTVAVGEIYGVDIISD